MDKEDNVVIHNELLLSLKNEMMSSASTGIDLEIFIRGEVSQTKTDMLLLICGI